MFLSGGVSACVHDSVDAFWLEMVDKKSRDGAWIS